MPPPPKRPDPKGATASRGEENIYIPAFISKKPFYASTGDDESGDAKADYLEHQRLQKKEKAEEEQWYARGKKAGPAATKYRKGACENCGSMSHKRRDCLDRPRKIGAKWSGRDIRADDVVKDVELGWDAKRDRWAGYDAREYRQTVEEFQQMEELRRKAQETAKEGLEGEDGDEGDKYAEVVDPTKHQSTATRQLRIREDTAKYLLNLDLESAQYNPKTRALINPGAGDDKTAELYAEEGFMRASGDAGEFERAQKYAWETQEKKGDTTQHLQANPTAGEFYRRKEREEEEKKRGEREKELLDKYGGEVHNSMPEALKKISAVTESETFVEYDEFGAIKGAPQTVARSKYPEDVYTNNHTTIFGSWWSDFKWGYACCQSFVKNSYCTGEDGIKAWEAAEKQRSGAGLIAEKEYEDDKEEGERTAEPKKRVPKKRTAIEMMDGITEEVLDQYRKKRAAENDPMAMHLGKDELVEN